jgi:hypothetical protein
MVSMVHMSIRLISEFRKFMTCSWSGSIHPYSEPDKVSYFGGDPILESGLGFSLPEDSLLVSRYVLDSS